MNQLATPDAEALGRLHGAVENTYPGGVHIVPHLTDGPYWLLTLPLVVDEPDRGGLGKLIIDAWPGIVAPAAFYSGRLADHEVAGQPAERVTCVPHFAGQAIQYAFGDAPTTEYKADNAVRVIRAELPEPPVAADWAAAMVAAISGLDGRYSPLVASSGVFEDVPGPLTRAVEQLGPAGVAQFLTGLGSTTLAAYDDNGWCFGYNDTSEQRLGDLLDGLLRKPAAA